MESRLKQIRKELGLKQEDLAQILNCSKSNISMIETSKSTLTEKNKKWLVQALNIDPQWLETGEGPMYLPDDDYAPGLAFRKGPAPAGVPVYDVSRLPGLSQLFRKDVDFKPYGFISIPNLPKCDGAIMIVGDSMNPILRSGDYVLYRQIESISEIFWGDMYLVSVGTSTEDRIMVRYIKKSNNRGKVILGAENQLFGDKEVALSDINALAFVKASIRMNSSK